MARCIFSQQETSDQVEEADSLQVDLVEFHDALPIDVKIKHTTLQQVGGSCCIIAKELLNIAAFTKGEIPALS